MGGKTGFKPLTLIIDAVHKKPGTTDLTQKVWAKGQIFINDDINPNFYLECMRPDTERANGKIFLVYPTMGRPWNDGFREEIDEEVPVLSTDRKSVWEGKRVSVRVDLGGRRCIKKK